MTTKYKIIFGFTGIIIILLIISAWSYRIMGGSLVNLGEYRRSVRVTVALGNSMSSLNEARSQLNLYLSTSDKAIMGKAMQATDNFIAQIGVAEKDMVRQENLDIARKIRADAQSYRENLAKVDSATVKLNDLYYGSTVSSTQKIEDITKSFRETALSANNPPMLAGLETMWEEYAHMLSGLGRYLYSRSDTEMKDIRRRHAASLSIVEGLSRFIIVEKGRQLHGQLLGAFKNVSEAITEMETAAKGIENARSVVRGMQANIFTSLAKVQGNFDAQMRALGAGMTTEIKNGETVMLGGGIAGILVGLFLSLFIIYGLSRVLREAGDFAGAVARGDFDYSLKSREGGEIGAMFAAMKQIPAVLSQFAGETHTLNNDILSGHLRNRLDTSNFSGTFTDLAGAVNMIGDAYTRIIDGLNVPLMCCDSRCQIRFLSKAAQQAVGGDPVGKICSEELKAGVCNSESCFGKYVMAHKTTSRGETEIRPPRGNAMAVSVTTTPLYDIKNELVGFMEMLADISEMTAKQNAITKLARDAEEISVRVASTSEELFSQIKEISHGTDLQRDRVHSTAGAMTEMNTAVLEVARNAGEASGQSENTRLKAQQGAELVNQVVKAINAVNEVGQNLQNNMQELGKQTESIGSVMNVISDIADQTNLLALNAAIEAARAGEAGRGFAVVADEVRKLAEKTMQATHEVGSSIHAIQQSARVNIDEVGKAVSNVTEANALANSSGEALNEIVNMAATNSASVASIATAAEEQSATSEEINQAIEEISKIVSDTAESMERSSDAVHGLSNMAQELRKMIDGLK